MHRYRPILRIVALLLLAASLLACSRGVDWSSRERENAANIQASLQATSNAASVANSMTGNDPAAREKLLQALRAAHLHAVRVEDSVLDKLHQRMYGKFRLDYQRALARMIRAYENGDPDAAQEAALEIRDFMDWYRREKHTFRWWRGGPGNGSVN
ncbi:MAG TPA: hypothetical protein VF275_04920 [Gammaproteobacteria bacterium]